MVQVANGYCNNLILKVDLNRLILQIQRKTKVKDQILHDLIIERATRQHYDYILQAAMKHTAVSRPE